VQQKEQPLGNATLPSASVKYSNHFVAIRKQTAHSSLAPRCSLSHVWFAILHNQTLPKARTGRNWRFRSSQQAKSQKLAINLCYWLCLATNLLLAYFICVAYVVKMQMQIRCRNLERACDQHQPRDIRFKVAKIWVRPLMDDDGISFILWYIVF